MDKSDNLNKNIVLITDNDYNKQEAADEVKIKLIKDIGAPVIRDTLDEKISETLHRDMTMILHKIEYVLKPRSVAESHKQLRNCIIL